MSLQQGDDLLQWACNKALRHRDVRFGSIRTLSNAVRETYAPCGVVSTDFHERLDGNQYLVMHHRRLLPTISAMLKDSKFAGVHKIIKNNTHFYLYYYNVHTT